MPESPLPDVRDLVPETIDGRPALVAYLSGFEDGVMVPPAEAKLVIARFANGEIRYYFPEVPDPDAAARGEDPYA